MRILTLFSFVVSIVFGMPSKDKPAYQAERSTQIITLDGSLNEDIWESASTTTGLIQQSPNSGEEATQKTVVRLIYDDHYVYVGARMYDSEPDKIAAQLFRRDGNGYTDWFEVLIDSYYDHRTAFGFQVNPKGVKKDNLYYNDDDVDETWDAVWEAATQMDAEGWTAEIRIPFSQLRYNGKGPNKTWGIQFWRYIARNGEALFWAPILQETQGFVSQFGTLTGINTTTNPKRLEIMPYSSGQLVREEGDKANPYYNENNLARNMGVDFKYGLGSNFTLTGTINPDFGQVEVDPAVVNLSAYETFFEERRPFFLEGTDIFNFGRTVTNNSNSPQIFYSRRIGRQPRGWVTSPDAVYTDVPDQTTIIAAVKLSGKTSHGWSLGLMNAVTAEETASYKDSSGSEKTEPVEPLSNNLVFRFKKDLKEGKSNIGGFLTSNHKNLTTDQFKTLLRKNATVGGIDFEHRLKNEDWIISGFFSLGNITGSEEVITKAQRSPARYFQRPDADYVSVDSTAKSLSGYSTELSVSKNSGKHWRGSLTYGEISPGYEINDLGFQQSSDYRSINSLLIYLENTPGKHIRNWNAYAGNWSSWTFGNQHSGFGLFYGGNITLNNFWYLGFGGNFGLPGKNIILTRGGPTSERPQDWRVRFNIRSDRRKKVVFGVGSSFREDLSGEYDQFIWGNMTVRPIPSLSIELEAEMGKEKDTDQYISQFEDALAENTYGTRYIFSDIESATQSISAQIDWTFSPDLTLQFYVSPFVTAYNYIAFKEFKKPGKFEFDYYGNDIGTLEVDEHGNSKIDPDGTGPAESFSLSNRDFNFRSVRLNAVLRWEYRSGSTLYFVWQQERDDFVGGLGKLNLSNDYEGLFKKQPVNTFVIKASYWFGY